MTAHPTPSDLDDFGGLVPTMGPLEHTPGPTPSPPSPTISLAGRMPPRPTPAEDPPAHADVMPTRAPTPPPIRTLPPPPDIPWAMPTPAPKGRSKRGAHDDDLVDHNETLRYAPPGNETNTREPWVPAAPPVTPRSVRARAPPRRGCRRRERGGGGLTKGLSTHARACACAFV